MGKLMKRDKVMGKTGGAYVPVARDQYGETRVEQPSRWLPRYVVHRTRDSAGISDRVVWGSRRAWTLAQRMSDEDFSDWCRRHRVG